LALYAQETRATFTDALAQALNDPNRVYWVQDELDRALNEALLLWGALSSYWTTSGPLPFSTVASVPFYDLSLEYPTLRARTYTMGDLTREIQYHFYEPANGVSGAGMTAQFTIGQITSALTRRRNQFVLDSRIPLTFTTVPAPPPEVSDLELANDVALITRAAWIEAVTGITTPLRRTDTFAAQSYNPIWNLNPKKPFSYSQAEAMPGTMILIPPPLGSGSVHLTYARTISIPVADTAPFLIPDEFAWALKYGAIYEILSTNSQGYDPLRTKYCMERYMAGIELAAAHRSVMRVRCNDVPLALSTLADLDSGKPTWQTSSGRPGIAACAYDLLAFYRVPDTAYSITTELSRSAPLPAAPTDFIQVGREEIPYLLDYCRHILMFKLGGTEFVQSMPLYDSFLKGATQRSRLIGVKARYLTPLFTVPALQESESNAA
jgi:hypothetical protein